MKKILAKFTSKCAETGKILRKGDPIYYDFINKKAYHPTADIVRIWESKQEQESERENLTAYVNAQEEAYFLNLYGFGRN